MTDIDIIKNAISTLDNLSIPNFLLEQVGIPVYNVSKDLKRLYEALIEQVRKLQEQQAQAAPVQEIAEEPREEIAEAGVEENA